MSFGSIVKFGYFMLNDCTKVCGFFMTRFREVANDININHIKKLKVTDDIVFIDMNESVKPAVCMNINNSIYAFALPNCWETD